MRPRQGQEGLKELEVRAAYTVLRETLNRGGGRKGTAEVERGNNTERYLYPDSS